MRVVYTDRPKFRGSVKPSLFLAGPTPRSNGVPSWRPKALEILKNLGFEGIVLVPERRNWQDGDQDFKYESQVNWERAGLEKCTKIVFWVPRKMKTMPALTTNVEFGYWLAREPKRVLYGRPNDAEHTGYLDWLFKLEKPKGVIHENLKALLTTACDPKELWLYPYPYR